MKIEIDGISYDDDDDQFPSSNFKMKAKLATTKFHDQINQMQSIASSNCIIIG